MGFPEFVVVIASIMALNPLAMDMMLPALPDIAAAFHITEANRAAGGAVDLPDRLRHRPVRDGAAVGPLRPPRGADRRHGAVLHRQHHRGHRTVVRDLAAGARAAGPRHLGDARDRDLDRARLLCRPPHGERDVARHDGVHRRARDRAVAGPGGAAVRTMARHLPRAVAVRFRRAGLERDTDAGNAAGVRAQVARAARRARRLPPDRDQPANDGLCAGGRRRDGLAVRLRAVLAAGLHRHLQARALFSDCVCGHRGRHRDCGLSQRALRRPPRHARDFARRAAGFCRRRRDPAGSGRNSPSCRWRCSWRSRR